MQKLTEKDIQKVIEANPHLLQVGWKLHLSEYWVADILRCDSIFIDENEQIILVEIKRNFAQFEDISQVLRYYGYLHAQGIQIHKVCLVARGFTDELIHSLKYSNITPIHANEQSIINIIKSSDESITGVYLSPKIELTHSNKFPHLPIHMVPNITQIQQIKQAYQRYQDKFNNTAQTHLYEIWEFTLVPTESYLVSVKHNGQAYHFQKTYSAMSGKSKASRNNSTRMAAWEYYKKNDLECMNLVIHTFRPSKEYSQQWATDKHTIESYVKEFIGENQ
ncbi:hypothetical protein ASG89_31950 [Paenibacillus sp. Soil766]|uniref:endonuclease NucS domain-containing protein n=1 Tax=Paenibacillus sp. Soil766 TaxID=1736404 RepID=UPI000708E055|nr:endonuclease NucS domain-containing protein [Paenibacillus sp. Soil766]KRE94906.1 hypothetical protein ASG89_31950 [Paenibacillus sp. Soil766]